MPRIGTTMGRIVAGIVLLPALAVAQERTTSFSQWLQHGHWTIDARYRFEHVDQSGFAEDASASTLRLRAGFKTARWSGFSALLEAELAAPIGSDRFNSTTNDRSAYPIVADPESSEINQALVYYKQGQNHVLLGRQKLPIDQQRFLGSVDFRQNQQTYDALMVMNRSFPGWTLVYGYMNGVRRFLGNDNPLGDIDMNSHLVNAEYVTPNKSRLTIYGQFLDMETPAITANSHRNVGVRYQGATGGEALRWLYHIEYADQYSYANGADIIDASYWRAEFGPQFANQNVVRLGIEQLSGDGTYAFQTPFATAHAYNGRAEVFAFGAPAAGLRDHYVKFETALLGARASLTFHQFDSDAGRVEYGNEFDIVVTYRFKQNYEFAFEFAQFNAKDFAADKRNVSISLSYSL